MKLFTQQTAVVLSAALLAACASGPTAFDTSADPAVMAKTYVKADGDSKIKGLKKVVIPYFQVEFVTKSYATVYSGAEKAQATSGVSYTLKGVRDADMQAITDKLYAKLVADLAASGTEVLSLPAMKQLPAYADVLALAKPAPVDMDRKGSTSRFFAPAGMAVYFSPDDQRLSLSSTFGNMFSTIGKRQPQQFEPDLQKQAGGATVLRVRYTVDFADLKTSKSKMDGMFSSSASASVNSSVGILLQPDATTFQFIVDGYPTFGKVPSTSLKKPVLSADSSWVSNVEEVNKMSNRVSEVGVAILSAASVLSGGGSMSASQRDYDVTVDAAAWAGTVASMAGSTEAMFLSQTR